MYFFRHMIVVSVVIKVLTQFMTFDIAVLPTINDGAQGKSSRSLCSKYAGSNFRLYKQQYTFYIYYL